MLQNIRVVVDKVAIWLFIGVTCFFIAALWITISNSVVKIDFFDNGEIKISHSSTETFGSLSVIITDKVGNEIFHKNVEKEEVIFALEREHLIEEKDGKQITDVIVVDSDVLYWKYLFDIKGIVDNKAEYMIKLLIEHDGKQIEVINTFVYDGEGYTYAVDNIKKEY